MTFNKEKIKNLVDQYDEIWNTSIKKVEDELRDELMESIPEMDKMAAEDWAFEILGWRNNDEDYIDSSLERLKDIYE